ncbi:dicarboxylate amino acid cation sodium transporter [Micractinium conductrix]|uniref:Amino acid transporter n=1 Tax=Micractinium conductrix TaxID=554055 RepID=A0A2P6V6K2_9CHLO|nr:dicarboxylate amino acid cation sodium transporter [Micractinium conductrix]|eukprot:PSC69711.1 dicarboxylate amino acid cation sodium transporter [Micractinium conductrix]
MRVGMHSSLSALRHTRPSDPLEVSPPPSPREGIASGCGGCASWRACVLHEPLLFFTLLGVLAGVALGVALKPAQLEAEAVELIGFPGELMLRLLKMLALPLISISMIAGVVGLRPSDPAGGGGVRRLAWLTAAFYIGSTLLAILVGILLVVALHPGRGAPFDAIAAAGGKGGCHAAQAKKVAQHASAQAEQRMSTTDALLSVARQVVPDNIAGAAVQMNVLGLITFSLMLGLALASLGPSADGVIKAVGVLNAAVQRMVTWALWLSPLGIGSLIAASILRACDLLGTLAALGLWVATVLAGLAIFAGLLLPALLWASTGRHPLATARAFASSLLMAFGSSSSAAALPQAMQSARDLGCDDSTVAFFLPLGTTVNMNGTALYEATTAIFIAQAHGVSLNAAQLVVVALTASLAAVGAPAIPSAGLVTMLIVLQAVGLEQYAGDLAVILAIDWLLDRVRTCVNLLGDAYGCVIVDDLMKRHSGSGSGRLAGSAGKQIPYIALEMGEGPGQAGQRGAAAAAAAGAAAGYGESKTPGAPR